ncbi:MAG: hypothetical protein ACI31A_05860, partial [Candidatus Limisoma sp.]
RVSLALLSKSPTISRIDNRYVIRLMLINGLVLCCLCRESHGAERVYRLSNANIAILNGTSKKYSYFLQQTARSENISNEMTNGDKCVSKKVCYTTHLTNILTYF